MPSFYGQSWDHYVAEVFEKMKREDSVFPGDEWGNTRLVGHLLSSDCSKAAGAHQNGNKSWRSAPDPENTPRFAAGTFTLPASWPLM